MAETSTHNALERDEVEQYHCGVKGCRPKWLQVFARPTFLSLILCLDSLVEATIIYGFIPVVFSTIEKRYRFSSFTASLILSTYSAIVSIAVIFVSYFGEKGHKPRWLGIGLIFQGIGSFVFASPKFLFGKYELTLTEDIRMETCRAGNTFLSTCEPTNNIAYFLFIIGIAINAIGASALFTIGISYLDDIIHPKKVSLHLGLFYLMTVIGPAIGFASGGALLFLYVDPGESTDLKVSDPGWVGAWWICFMISGTMSLVLAIPFLMCPRLLADSYLVMQARQMETSKCSAKYEEEKTFWKLLKCFPCQLKKQCMNPTWLCITISVTVVVLTLDGMIAFGPKYFESVFGVPASISGITLGAIAILAGGAGILTGAIIMYYMEGNGRKAARLNVIVSFLAIIPTFIFLASCPNVPIGGINSDYPNGQGGSGLLSPCNRHCNCTSTIFEPVCGADGLTYFSPCRAGCEYSKMAVFQNCSCIVEGLGRHNTTIETYQPNSTADSGLCEQDCTLTLVAFIIGIFSMLFLISLMNVPAVIITIRCVADEMRTLSLGVQATIFRLFGAVPGVIIIGVLFDSACTYWQHECNGKGNCWVYDNRDLGLKLFGAGVGGVFSNFIFSVLTWVFYPQDQDSKKEETGRNKSGSESNEDSEIELIKAPEKETD